VKNEWRVAGDLLAVSQEGGGWVWRSAPAAGGGFYAGGAFSTRREAVLALALCNVPRPPVLDRTGPASKTTPCLTDEPVSREPAEYAERQPRTEEQFEEELGRLLGRQRRVAEQIWEAERELGAIRRAKRQGRRRPSRPRVAQRADGWWWEIPRDGMPPMDGGPFRDEQSANMAMSLVLVARQQSGEARWFATGAPSSAPAPVGQVEQERPAQGEPERQAKRGGRPRGSRLTDEQRERISAGQRASWARRRGGRDVPVSVPVPAEPGLVPVEPGLAGQPPSGEGPLIGGRREQVCKVCGRTGHNKGWHDKIERAAATASAAEVVVEDVEIVVVGDVSDDAGWSEPGPDGARRCLVCVEGIDRRPGEGSGRCCLNCLGDVVERPAVAAAG